MLNWLRRLLVCDACNAHQYTIAILKEELRQKDDFISGLEDTILNSSTENHELIKHLTGMNRNLTQAPTGPLHSVARDSGIRARIARAEKATYKPELTEQRHKEYEERIAALSRPEIEVQDDAG